MPPVVEQLDCEQLVWNWCGRGSGATGGCGALFFASNGSDSQLLLLAAATTDSQLMPAAGSDQLGMLNAGSVVVVVVEIKTAVASQQMKTTHLSWG